MASALLLVTYVKEGRSRLTQSLTLTQVGDVRVNHSATLQTSLGFESLMPSGTTEESYRSVNQEALTVMYAKTLSDPLSVQLILILTYSFSVVHA